MLSFVYAECHNTAAECHNTAAQYAKCRYIDSRDAVCSFMQSLAITPSMLSVVMLSFVYAECHNTAQYAKCRYNDSCHAVCRLS
jgi:hypothetical protein